MANFNINQRIYVDTIFEDLDLSHQTLASIEFDHVTFLNGKFIETTFDQCKFVDCVFKESDLTRAKIKQSRFSDVLFEESKVVDVNWTTASWPQIKLNPAFAFHRSTINQSNFLGVYLHEVEIINCIAHGVDFREADMSNACLQGTDLKNSLFVHTNLTSADFTDAINYFINIHENKLKGAKFSLPDAVNLLRGLDIEIEGDG